MARWLWLAALPLAAMAGGVAHAWTPKPVADDPLVRMPGTQHGDNLALSNPAACTACHDGFDPSVDLTFHWRGSMMAQALRDPLFWAALTVSAQDSIWAVGNPNAADLCLRCHAPGGWAGGRSEPPNGSMMTGPDYDGVHCDACHAQIDPFFETTANGTREGNDWSGYWDEAEANPNALSSVEAQDALAADRLWSQGQTLFNGTAFYNGYLPSQTGYTEATSGQFFLVDDHIQRAAFADANALHGTRYSRFHKSRFYCGTCHDVSNAVLANLPQAGATKNDGVSLLTTETQPAHTYGHIERTFSEFMLSAYGQGPGAAGVGPYAPGSFDTSQPGDLIASCQDCHMPDVPGKGAKQPMAVDRPSGSVEHPNSGQPLHDLTGGNLWVPWLLASTVPTSSNYRPGNAALLGQGPTALTLDLTQGMPLDPAALLHAVGRARATLERAAAVENVTYDDQTGALSFRVQNHSGHKLISGYPEGRRLWVNVQLFAEGALIHEVNPYDPSLGSLKGPPSGTPLGSDESYDDALVYEVKQSSSLTGESQTFHLALATDRYKDNRIPPKGFRINEAAARLSEPVVAGGSSPSLFTAAEYAGGYDDVAITVPAGADGVRVQLYYQTTSREYVAFLRDEIDGTATSLTSPAPSGEATAYIAQSDPYFSALAAWGSTIWQLWDDNRVVPGAAPVPVARGTVGFGDNPCAAPGADGEACDDSDACTTGETCSGGTCGGGTAVVCQAVGSCHEAGTCDPVSGLCDTPVRADGSSCDAGGTCQAGVCEMGSGGGGGVGGAGGIDPGPGGSGASSPGGSSGSGQAPPPEGGGCGCRVGAPTSAHGWGWLGLGALLALRRRRTGHRGPRP